MREEPRFVHHPITVSDVQAEVEVLGVYGPSGSGKTSLLEVIAGLRVPRSGAVSVGGEVLADTSSGIHLPPYRRHVGYVPQDGALFPHLDARRNVMYGSDSRLPSANAETCRSLRT